MEARATDVLVGGQRYRIVSELPEEQLALLVTRLNASLEGLGPKAAQTASPAHRLTAVALDLLSELTQRERDARQLVAELRDALGRAENLEAARPT